VTSRSIALAFVVAILSGCRGFEDGEDAILNGYALRDAGGYQRTITYDGGPGNLQIVVAPRVDNYLVEGQSIILARRPWDGRAMQLGIECDYLVVDTVKHTVTQIKKGKRWPQLRCD
jgi:hypothetical protein